MLVITNLLPEFQRSRNNTNQIVILTIHLVILVIGFYGAYRGHRQALLLFAMALTIIVILAVVQSQAIAVIGNAVLDIIAIFLSVWQSEMIRSGDL